MKISSYTYRLIALTMAFLMLFSSVGFSIDMHYCQGKLKSFSFFGEAKNCHEMAKEKACPHHQKKIEQEATKTCSIDKKDCCQNKTLHFQCHQDQQIQASDLVLSQLSQQFVVAFVAVFFKNNFTETTAKSSYTHYKPPIIPRDISVLFESFLL